jgi:hypothetical protein
MAYSDYLEIKKKLEIKKHSKKNNNIRNSSNRTQNNQYLHLQNTSIINEDGEEELKHKRFNIILPKNCALYSRYNNKSNFSFMYSIPRIHIPEYEKNRYQPAFCWTCYTPLGEITNYIACSVCDQGPSCTEIKEMSDEQPIIGLDVETIDKIINEFDNTNYIFENDDDIYS